MRTLSKRRPGIRWAAGWVLLGLAGLARAQAAREASFMVDGLLVDDIEAEETHSDGPFKPYDWKVKPPREPDPASAPPPAAAMSPGVSIDAPPTGKALERLKAAEMYADNKDWGRALEEIHQGVQLAPRNILLLRRGAALAALDAQYALADEFYRRLMELQPKSIAHLNGRVGVLMRMKRWKDARALSEAGARSAQGNLLARFNNLVVRMAQGEAPPPSENWSVLRMGELMQVVNWLDADRAVYEELLTPEGFARLCAVILAEGVHERLGELLQVLRRIARNEGLKQWDTALQAIQEAEGMGLSTLGLGMEQARVWTEKNEIDKARSIMETLAQRFPQQADVLYNYAYTLIQAGEYPGALPVLDRVVGVAPGNLQAQLARACVLAELGRVDEAWPILTRLMDERPAETRTALQGDAPYMRALKADPRFAALQPARPPGR